MNPTLTSTLASGVLGLAACTSTLPNRRPRPSRRTEKGGQSAFSPGEKAL